MAEGFTAALVNGWLDGSFATASCYLRLHTASPGAAGTSAVSAGDNTRKQATMAAASGGSKAASAAVGPWTNGGTSETITDLSVWDDASGTTFKASVTLDTSQAWVSTNTLEVDTFSIGVTPIAS